MQKNDLKKIFKLEGYILDRVEYLDEEILLHCHIQGKIMIYKGIRSKQVNEIKMRKISHMMLEDKKVYLVIQQRRFYFSKYKIKRWEMLPDIQKRKQTTNTFRLHTLRELQRDNYRGIGFKRKMSGMFPMKILDTLKIDIQWRKGVKKVGLDGKCVKKHTLVHHISDLEKGKSIGVFPNFSQKEFKKNF